MSADPTPEHAMVLAPGVWIDPGRLSFSFVRSSGPGGQSVNKLSTKAELRVALTDIQGLDERAEHRLRRLAGSRLTTEDELIIQADETRSQRRNREACLERFCDLVRRAATPPKKRKPTRPSRAAREKRLREKREHAEKKQRRRQDKRPGRDTP